MSDTSFCYMTRPTAAGNATTTGAKYRGTKTEADLLAEVATRLGSSPPTPAAITRLLCEVIVDWTIACWKIEPLGAGLIGFQCASGGSAPIGTEPPTDFEGMHISLNGYYGPAGRDRARAAFSAQKVGEQSRITPVFVEVYDSASRTPNHYVAGGTLTIIMGNRNGNFDPNSTGHFVKYRKGDGTYVTAGGYPYRKGNTIVANVPAGLSGSLELHIAMEINGTVREGVYPFPLS